MGKLIGYLIALAGLVILAIPFMSFIPVPEQIKPVYLMIGGIAIIIVGIALTLGKRQSKQLEEVPIYEGAGKKRIIVGYQKIKQ